MNLQRIEEQIRPMVRVQQIVVFALTMGCGMFLAVVLAISGNEKPPFDVPLVTYVAVGMAVATAGARLFVPNAMVTAFRRQWAHSAEATGESTRELSPDAVRRLCGVYQTKTIIGASLLEGSAFTAIIAYLQERTILSLALAALLTVAVAAHFPTPGRVAEWIEAQWQELKQDRLFGG
jgi:hypothetical protein